MGFSVAAAAAILFAGTIVAFTTVVASIEQAGDSLREAQERSDAKRLDLLNTRISLVNGSTNGTAVDLNLTNNGSTTIHAKRIEVLINGTLATANTTLREVEGINSTDLWLPGQTLRLVVATTAGAPVAVKIVTDSGYAFYTKVS